MRWVMVAGAAGDDAKPYRLAALPAVRSFPAALCPSTSLADAAAAAARIQEPAVSVPARVVAGTRIVTAWGTTRAEIRSVISRVPPSSS